MLINFSNHPQNEWTKEQIDTATEQYGGIVDIPFPDVDPKASFPDVQKMSESCVIKLQPLVNVGDVVHIMGEHTLTFMIVSRLKSLGIRCIASCTERICRRDENGDIVRSFAFRQFRPYF